MHWLWRDRRTAFAVGWLLLVTIVAVAAPIIAPYDLARQELTNVLEPPSAEHWLGTDDLGRDSLSRLLFGARVSLIAAVTATGFGLILGVPVGLIAGFVGGVVDNVFMRMVDTLLSFPAIVLAVGVIGVLGPGLRNAMIAVGIIFAPSFARLVRGQVLSIKNRLYVDAARTFGSTPLRIIVRHVLPNSIQPVIVQAAFLMAVALLAEAALSFLGLGVQPPTPSWGEMLRGASRFVSRAPWQVYPPGLAIALAVLAFNLLGDTLRDSFDPVASSVRRLRVLKR